MLSQYDPMIAVAFLAQMNVVASNARSLRGPHQPRTSADDRFEMNMIGYDLLKKLLAMEPVTELGLRERLTLFPVRGRLRHHVGYYNKYHLFYDPRLDRYDEPVYHYSVADYFRPEQPFAGG